LRISYRNILGDTRIQDAVITPSMHQVLIGTLLGDGFMKTGRMYAVGHGINQLHYIYHVAEKLHGYVASIGDRNTDSVTEKSFEFWTFSHENLNTYFKKFYSRGRSKKYMIVGAASDLAPEGLSYWYMDDGKYNEYGLYLCVGNISEDEGIILRGILRDTFGLVTTFQCANDAKGYHNIYIKAESRGHFIELIAPYIIPPMKYKITGQSHQNVSFSKDVIIPLHDSLCKKAGRYIRYFGDSSIKKEVEQVCSISDPKEDFISEIRRRAMEGLQVSRTCYGR
jgi:hypothetical protein